MSDDIVISPPSAELHPERRVPVEKLQVGSVISLPSGNEVTVERVDIYRYDDGRETEYLIRWRATSRIGSLIPYKAGWLIDVLRPPSTR